MKAVADTRAVARSNLIELVSRRARWRRPYRKAGDDELLALIRRLVDERPTYGYRRIRRLINRQRKANGKPPVNGNRVLRIMQANKLTLERHTGRRLGRTHDGVVIALRSNIRWCSDHFELACRNGEIVRVFLLSNPSRIKSLASRQSIHGDNALRKCDRIRLKPPPCPSTGISSAPSST
jgi:putative transposase